MEKKPDLRISNKKETVKRSLQRERLWGLKRNSAQQIDRGTPPYDIEACGTGGHRKGSRREKNDKRAQTWASTDKRFSLKGRKRTQNSGDLRVIFVARTNQGV